MQTYRNGARAAKVQEKLKVKRHLKEFYKGMNKIQEIANELSLLDVVFTEDNINEYASSILGRDLDSMEVFLLLGKLGTKVADETQDNNK